MCKKKECMICGNSNVRELELETLFSDGDGTNKEFRTNSDAESVSALINSCIKMYTVFKQE